MKRIFLIWLVSLVVLPLHALELGQVYRIVPKKFPGKSLFVNNSQRDDIPRHTFFRPTQYVVLAVTIRRMT